MFELRQCFQMHMNKMCQKWVSPLRKYKISVKRWYRCRRNRMTIFIIIILCIACYIKFGSVERELDLNVTRIYIESRLQEALKEDKGSGCEIPQLDPFAKEVTQFDKDEQEFVCSGKDWVKCFHSKCKVVPEILASTKNIKCDYFDIIYDSDEKYHIGAATTVYNSDVYTLTASDHVKISCIGTDIKRSFFRRAKKRRWDGFSTGFRSTVERKPVPKGREDTFNVLIFELDSTSKNCFIRRMPKSYKYLSTHMKGTILNGYNVLGDGTPAALFPLLTGKTELEFPDVRRGIKAGNLDVKSFIFHKLKEDGYRTAYFEDMPWIGTFQYRFNGFLHQPADHYLRAFYLEAHKSHWWKLSIDTHCVGETPQYKLMMNITHQFLRLDGKKFILTMVDDLTHDGYKMMSSADEDIVKFLKILVDMRITEDTLVMVMADHGARFTNIRETLQGKLEERLPLMAILLPERLKRQRPDAQSALEANVNALTTPHDIYATILDVLDMRHHQNPYKVTGADLLRGMTLLEPIPRNRSCSEAGIEPHWCVCVRWLNVSSSDPIYFKVGDAFVSYINSMTEVVRSECVVRTLLEVKWVMRKSANQRLLKFGGARDIDGYLGTFNAQIQYTSDIYQLQVVVGPGRAVFEASLKYFIDEDRFLINSTDISRINSYGGEPSCMSAKLPHLNPYCYCREYVKQGI